MTAADPGNGGTGDESIHLKFGGGVYIQKIEQSNSTRESITFIGTGMEIKENSPFNFNTFSTSDRIIVCCKTPSISNGSDSENIVKLSQNFSVKGFRSDNVTVSIKKNGIVDITTSLNIYRETKSKKYEEVCKAVQSGSVIKLADIQVSPLCFGLPKEETVSGAEYDSLEIEFIGS